MRAANLGLELLLELAAFAAPVLGVLVVANAAPLTAFAQWEG